MAILVLTPLRDELAAICSHLEQLGHSIQALPDVGHPPAFWVRQLGIYLAHGGHGKAQFAIHTKHFVDVLRTAGQAPELVVCAGAAGALADDLRVGDVVAALETIEHDYNLRFSVRPLPRFAGDPRAIDRLRKSNGERPFGLHFGIVASGDEDVIDVARGRQLREQTGAEAVAWEGAGGARAAEFCGVPFLELRGITDTADHLAAAHFEANLPRAMTNVAAVLLDLARNSG